MVHEQPLYARIQVAASRLGLRLFRNNVGVLEDKRGGKVRFGLCVGSSDLIGWAPREIGGQPVAVFVAIEVKDGPRKATPEQINFIEAVKAAGGIAGIARSVEEAVDLISRGMREAT